MLRSLWHRGMSKPRKMFWMWCQKCSADWLCSGSYSPGCCWPSFLIAPLLPNGTQGPPKPFHRAAAHLGSPWPMLCHGLSRPQGHNLLPILRFLLAHHSSLSLSFGMATLPSSAVSALINVVSSTNVMKKHSLISSRSLKAC